MSDASLAATLSQAGTFRAMMKISVRELCSSQALPAENDSEAEPSEADSEADSSG